MLDPNNVYFEILEENASSSAEAAWIEYFGEQALNISKNPLRKRVHKRGRMDEFMFMGKKYTSMADASRDTGKTVKQVRYFLGRH